jgi:cell wall-associated NlpC family hydrolase
MVNPAAAVRFALDMVGSPYVYGAANKPCTPAMRKGQMRQYPGAEGHIRLNCPVLSGRAAACYGCPHEGKAAFDCAQLTRFALLAAGISLPSGASSQWKAEVFSEKAELVAPLPLSHIVLRLPCLVFRRDPMGPTSRPMAHVGLSLGDGRAVDARSHRRGVLLSPLDSYPWTHYALPRGFQGEEGEAPAETLYIGARGEAVTALQRGLLRLGFPLPLFGTDGIFGPETMAAVRAFQFARNLSPTGIADSLTLITMERG